MTGKTRQTELAVAALAGGCTQAGAARRAGVGERTIARWLSRDEFRQRVAKARGHVLDRLVGALADNATVAVATLGELLLDESPVIRLGASRAVLDGLLKVRSEVEIENRLSAIESTLAQKLACN